VRPMKVNSRDTATMNTDGKRFALLALARKRQADALDGYSRRYFHLRDFDCECDHVVPWTISACNVDADLMLIAQDWASEEFLNGLSEDERQVQRALGQFPSLPTNIATSRPYSSSIWVYRSQTLTALMRSCSSNPEK
jgi:hypothetical protein